MLIALKSGETTASALVVNLGEWPPMSKFQTPTSAATKPNLPTVPLVDTRARRDSVATLLATVSYIWSAYNYCVKYLGVKPRGFTVLGSHRTRR